MPRKGEIFMYCCLAFVLKSFRSETHGTLDHTGKILDHHDSLVLRVPATNNRRSQDYVVRVNKGRHNLLVHMHE